MKTNAYLGLLMALGLAACGGSDSKTTDNDAIGACEDGVTVPVGAWVDVNGDGIADGKAIDANNDGIPESYDRNGDAKIAGSLPCGARVVAGGDTGGVPGGSSGGGNTQGGGTGPTLGQDGGANGGFDDRDATVISGEPAEVKCGTSTCTVKDNFACCEEPSDSGWTASCIGASGCSGAGGPPRNSTAECDDAKDCGGLVEQYCCFVMQGPPESFIGPGTPYGRECRTVADCNDSMGFPQGTSKFSCSDDSDCPNNGKCAPEEAGATTGGGGRKPRPWVKVCK